jgi:hypothetical protein
MPMKAPRPEAGNSPQGILEPPEQVPDAVPALDVPSVGDVAPEVAPAPAEMAPGVYSGVWPNLVLTATVDENGVMVPVPEATPKGTTT